MRADPQLMLPEWVVTLVGKLTLDNEALRRELQQADPGIEPENEHEQDAE